MVAMLTSCSSDDPGPSHAPLGGDEPVGPSVGVRPEEEDSWRIPFADENGAIETRVEPAAVGRVEFETDGPTEILAEVSTNLDPMGARRTEIGWADYEPLASPGGHSVTVSPVVAEGPWDCSPNQDLMQDGWTDYPQHTVGLQAPEAGRYVLVLAHDCMESVVFTVRPAEATRGTHDIVGSWSVGWLPSDAGWDDGEPMLPGWLELNEDGTGHYCMVFDVDDVDVVPLQWEVRSEGRIEVRRPDGTTAAPSFWRLENRLVLIDPDEAAMGDWLYNGNATNGIAHSDRWVAGLLDHFHSRQDSERPGNCS